MAHPKTMQPLVTPEEYLEGEKSCAFKNEFVAGVVYAMSGVTEAHNDICLNLATWLHSRMPLGCRVFNGAVKLRTKLTPDASYYYPDVFISCGPRKADNHVRDDATLVVEVLSKSTERIDKGEKLLAYTAMPSILEYLIVSQDGARVEVSQRRTAWDREIHETGSSIELDSIQQSLPLSEIYRDLSI